MTSIAQDLESMGFRKGINASGSINVSNIFYHTGDSLARRDPYQFILTGNLNVNIFGYDAPFSFTYSNSQRSYTQPFNRLSFNPRYKWIKVYLGHTSMSFSPYTLAGHSFKGAGVELTPGNWRLAMMTGQLKKAIEYNPLPGSPSIPSYRRMGYGLKFGYEKGSSGILVNLFTGKDDQNSIRNVPGNVLLRPMQNIAVGVTARTSLFRHFVLDGEYSISILNPDLRLELFADSQLQTESSPFSSELAGTQKLDAYSFGAGYQSSPAGIMLKYERVSPDYQSLGAYYFNNDLENLTIAPTLRLSDGRFSLTGNAGMQRNNLDKSRESTTKRFVGAGNININLSEKWNITFNYSNFSTYTNMKPQEDPFFLDNMDSLNFYQVTNQAGISANYAFGKSESPGNLMIISSFQRANETNSGSGSGHASDFITANACYSQSIKDPDVTFSVLYNLNSSKAPEIKSFYHGPGISVSKIFADKKLRAAFNSTYNRNTVNGQKGSPVLANGLNFNYLPKKTNEGKQNISLNLTWVHRFSSVIQNQRSEITGNLNYSYAF